jgi:RNA polymerase sigma-54 factor
LTAARFVIQCLNRRQEAIYKVACEIVRHQRDFFEHGLVHLKPLTQGELAWRMGFSQTTVTRAVRHKTMQTPYGLMKFESFFSLGYSTADGNRMTIASVKALVAQCIAEEEPCHPLSDVQLAHQLIKKGVPIARRTVGKYRHELGIPRAHLRQAHSNRKQ